ncbi:MAG: efflux RND transporter periplasmic adaptor subunit [Acidobacteriota bacterium]|nr:efflux RND transporter periplasmic adaptor subunit [Acidobacteriota bacterium]
MRRLRAATLACVSLLAVLWGTGCGSAGGNSSAGAATPAPSAVAEEIVEGIAVEAIPALQRPLSNLYTTSATLRADRHATVVARTAGVIRRLLVEEGDRVREGQELALLEDDEQRIEYERANTTYQTKKIEFERAERLHAQGLMSDEEFDTRRRESEEARQSASLLELTLTRTRVRSPFAGTIVLRHLDPGASVSNGTAVYDLADLDPLYADVNVPERQVSRLETGQQVRLFAGEGDTVDEARIERISPVVDPDTGTVKVTLSVHRRAGLRPGGFIRLQIVTDTHADAIVVPRNALVAEGRRWHLYRVNDDQTTVERIEVTRGYEEGDWVGVRRVGDGSPIVAGDVIVSVGAPALSDGAVVEVIASDADESDRVAS